MTFSELCGGLEALLFASGEPVLESKICDGLRIDEGTLKKLTNFLNDQYEERGSGLTILALGGALQMASSGKYSDVIGRTLHPKRLSQLSPAALEILSIVAYREPVTRAYIEQVRGVDSSGALQGLLEKGFIKEDGKLDAPGRPNLYVTTREFLRVFGIGSLSELPEIPELNENEESEDNNSEEEL